MTMTMTDESVLEDLDIPTPCIASPNCETPATWNWICGRCGFHGPTCDQHREAIDRTVALPNVRWLECSICKLDTKRDYRWEPLGGAR